MTRQQAEAVVGKVIVAKINRQVEAVSAIESHGGRVLYNFEMSGCRVRSHGFTTLPAVDDDRPHVPPWLWKMLGDAYFGEVEAADMHYASIQDNDLELLVNFPKLRMLDLSNARISDKGMASVGRLSKLTLLWLTRTPIGDDGLAAIAGLRELRGLDLTLTAVTNGGLRHLTGMTNLDSLDLSCTRVTRGGIARWAGSPNSSTCRL